MDAALASMGSAGGGNGDDEDLIVKTGSLAPSGVRISSLVVAGRGRDKTARASSSRYPHGAPSARFASKLVYSSIKKDFSK